MQAIPSRVYVFLALSVQKIAKNATNQIPLAEANALSFLPRSENKLTDLWLWVQRQNPGGHYRRDQGHLWSV